MKYLRVLADESAHEAFKNGSDYVEPNVCLLKNIGGVRVKVYTPPAKAGDVAYYDGSSVKTTPYSKWNTSLGTPVGVVVVPEGFAPDGRPRIVSLLYADRNGNASTSAVSITWGPYIDTELTNFNRVPTTDNNGSTSTGSDDDGYLPSDKSTFTGNVSFVDPKAKYYDNIGWRIRIPSPYLGETPNPEYYKEILSNGINVNALSDFNGLSNTETLVGLGSDYVAANACWKYNDGVSNLQWYLPSIGELGYLIPRFNEINSVITALGGVAVDSSGDIFFFWSSSEDSSTHAYYLNTYYGGVSYYNKSDNRYYMRPFSIL